MEIIFQPKAKDDLLFWKKAGNNLIKTKIQNLLKDIQEHPFEGVGKPEPLKHQLSGMWSRRINKEHRIIYEVVENTIHIYSLKDHY